jgi:uncharacterized Rmd1/YagE family protein
MNDGTYANKILRTGRQRKKLAARSKGGEFQQKRKKRRVYFCCVSSEIDVEQLHDDFEKIAGQRWRSGMYEGVLHLFMTGYEIGPGGQPETTKEDLPTGSDSLPAFHHMRERSISAPVYEDALRATEEENPDPLLVAKADVLTHHRSASYSEAIGTDASVDLAAYSNNNNLGPKDESLSGNAHDGGYTALHRKVSMGDVMDTRGGQTASLLWSTGGKEVFVFDFGAIVFWGFHRGEEEGLLRLIREFATGRLSMQEFEEGRDDMAFITSSLTDGVSIANDVITLPDDASAKSRLSVSFAIAQSSVLAIFEARIERKVEEYKYIPETLATTGKVRLSPRQLGGMIGEVYVIRHDVNLHSEILDTPDFFWKEHASIEAVYRLTMGYLEMTERTEILNKRLDMLRELLGVLQQQHENAHSMKLEWIVIWLIVISVVVETVAILVNLYVASS